MHVGHIDISHFWFLLLYLLNLHLFLNFFMIFFFLVNNTHFFLFILQLWLNLLNRLFNHLNHLIFTLPSKVKSRNYISAGPTLLSNSFKNGDLSCPSISIYKGLLKGVLLYISHQNLKRKEHGVLIARHVHNISMMIHLMVQVQHVEQVMVLARMVLSA